jgi:hypothetical protein
MAAASGADESLISYIIRHAEKQRTAAKGSTKTALPTTSH